MHCWLFTDVCDRDPFKELERKLMLKTLFYRMMGEDLPSTPQASTLERKWADFKAKQKEMLAEEDAWMDELQKVNYDAWMERDFNA